MHEPQTFDVVGTVATFGLWGPTKQDVNVIITTARGHKKNRMRVNLMPDVTRKRNRLFRLVVKLQSNHVVLAEITMHILHQQTIEIARRRREIVYRDTNADARSLAQHGLFIVAAASVSHLGIATPTHDSFAS